MDIKTYYGNSMSFELTLIQIFLLGTSGGIFNHKKKI